jgi:hypothetical protein
MDIQRVSSLWDVIQKVGQFLEHGEFSFLSIFSRNIIRYVIFAVVMAVSQTCCLHLQLNMEAVGSRKVSVPLYQSTHIVYLPVLKLIHMERRNSTSQSTLILFEILLSSVQTKHFRRHSFTGPEPLLCGRTPHL